MNSKGIVSLLSVLVCAAAIASGCGDEAKGETADGGVIADTGEDGLDSGGGAANGDRTDVGSSSDVGSTSDVGPGWDVGSSSDAGSLDAGDLDAGNGSDVGGSSDAGSLDAGGDPDAAGDTDAGSNCGSLAEGEARCLADGLTVESCSMGQLSEEACPEGQQCSGPEGSAVCECDNLADNICPDGCTNDPDCNFCEPDCSGKTCGPDGCSGTCGTCPTSDVCIEGSCEPSTLCSNTCTDSNDGWCDDGGPGSDYAICDLGTDCGDCGVRQQGG